MLLHADSKDPATVRIAMIFFWPLLIIFAAALFGVAIGPYVLSPIALFAKIRFQVSCLDALDAVHSRIPVLVVPV